MLPQRLGSRIAALVIATLLGTQLATYAVVHAGIDEFARETLGKDMDISLRITVRLLERRTAQLEKSSITLAETPAFHTAALDRDHAIAQLIELAGPIGADRASVVLDDGSLVADALGLAQAPAPELAALLDRARKAGHASVFMVAPDNGVRRVFALRLDTRPARFVLLGIPFDEGSMRNVALLTEQDIAVTATTKGRPALVASSLEIGANDRLEAALVRNPPRDDGELRDFDLGDGRRSSLAVALPGLAAEPQLHVLVLRPPEASVARFEAMRHALLAVTLGALGLGVLLTIGLARSVSGPVSRLAREALRIGRGEYAGAICVDGSAEVRELGAALDTMRGAIAERERQITEQAFRDSLTGLGNRACFLHEIETALAQADGRRVTVVLVNLNRFSAINEALGPLFADHVLIRVAARLDRLARGPCKALARLGADEFACLVVHPPPSARSAHNPAHALIDALARQFETTLTVDAQPVDISVRLGSADYPLDAQDAVGLLRRAGLALAEAQRLQHSHVAFTPELKTGPANRLTLMSELRDAIDGGQLELHHQPKVGIGDGVVHSFECLLRWRHPQRGMIAPDSFIPWAEQTGFIKRLTLWVLDEACAELARLQLRGLRIPAAINISAVDLMNPQLPQLVEEALARHRLAPALLRLEITESAAMHEPQRALATLGRLRALGVGLAIDDFGTGQSSLAYLSRFPVDELKIDRSFVRGMCDHREDALLVRSTIDLGHLFNLRVVAEGVEDERTLRLLGHFGCDLVQGFIVCRPMPAAELAPWLARHLARDEGPLARLDPTATVIDLLALDPDAEHRADCGSASSRQRPVAQR